MASVALLIAFSTSIAASAEHRTLATENNVLATASQVTLSAIQSEPSVFTSACNTPVSAYPGYGGISLPAPYTASNPNRQYSQYSPAGAESVQYATTNAVQYWNAQSGVFQPASVGCIPNVPQLITIDITGTNDSNSFVVTYPVGTSNGSSSTTEVLRFLNTVVGGYAGTPFQTEPIVAVETMNPDGTYSPVTTDISPVILQVNDISDSGLLSGCTGNEILGVVTFSGCTVGSGGSYSLTATDGSIPPVTSNTFSETTSNFSLSFSTQPVMGNASGSGFTTSPVVQVLSTISPYSLDTAWSGSITLTFSGGILTGTGCGETNSTTITLQAAGGQVTLPSACNFEGGYFYDASSNPPTTATQYTMTATANPNSGTDAAVPALSQSFSVSGPGQPSQLVFSTEPTGVASSTASTVFTGQPAVTIEDAFNNVVTSATNSISLSMYLGVPTQGTSGTSETLNPCTQSLAIGVDTFSGCSGSGYNNGLYLIATSTGLTSATSTNFNITRPASQLLFTTTPVAPVAEASGSIFAVQPTLVFEDSTGSVVTSITTPISLAPSGGTLTTCTSLVPNLGYVYVQNCAFAGLVGTKYTLTASNVAVGGTLTSAPSVQFSPTGAGPASQLVFTTYPIASASGSPFSTQPVIKVEDSAGNVVTSSTVSVTLTTSGGTLASCLGTSAAAGVINASGCTFAGVVGTPYTMSASNASGTLTSAPWTTQSFTPTGPGLVSQIVLSGCPSAITTTKSCSETATLEDNYANVETGDNSSVVSFAQTAGSGSFVTLPSMRVASGVATVALTGANAGPVTFDASADSVTSTMSPTVTVNPLPSITTTSLPNATVSQASYSQPISITGGTSGYTWSETGALPPGLSFNNATGYITGSPTTAGTYNFSATVTDADGATSASQPLSIKVNAPPALATSSLPAVTVGQSTYSQSLTSDLTGGTGPLTWSESGALPGGLSFSGGTISGSSISGTPGTFTFTVSVTDANAVMATQTYSITLNAAPTITTTTAPGATHGSAYSYTLQETGGSGALTYALTGSNPFPGGITLVGAVLTATNVTATASATPYTFSVMVTDANSVTTTQTISLTVNAPPTITTTTASGATHGGAYSFTLQETGGSGALTYALTGANPFPGGITLVGAVLTATNVTATASATPYTFSVKVTDANNATTTQTISLTVNAPPALATSSLPAVTVGQSTYSQSLTSDLTGGTGPLTWSESGALPGGLSFSGGTISGSSISGTPGTFTFTVSVFDANAVTASHSFSITLNAAPTVTPATLPNGVYNSAYNQTIHGTGGTGTLTFAQSSGSLPPGLTLLSTGVLSGTPTVSTGTYTFSVKATDTNGVASSAQSFSVTVT
jgi:hypothetical protein